MFFFLPLPFFCSTFRHLNTVFLSSLLFVCVFFILIRKRQLLARDRTVFNEIFSFFLVLKISFSSKTGQFYVGENVSCDEVKFRLNFFIFFIDKSRTFKIESIQMIRLELQINEKHRQHFTYRLSI